MLALVEEQGAGRHVMLKCPQLPGFETSTTKDMIPQGCAVLARQLSEFMKANGNPQTQDELNDLFSRAHMKPRWNKHPNLDDGRG
jgi:hypothetical protein